MIEAKKQQELYSVGDALPANGKVTLAKILPKQVVIDNNGTYELITLFSDNGIGGSCRRQPSQSRVRVPKTSQCIRAGDRPGSAAAISLAISAAIIR